MNEVTIIGGQKGSKKGGATSAKDTIKSNAYVSIVDAISEGEIVGLVDGANSIYINRTPIANLEDTAWEIRRGLPDDTPLSGFNSTEALVNVGVQINNDIGPQIRTITDTSISQINVHMTLNVLYSTGKNGALEKTNSGWIISVRPAGGEWTVAHTERLNSEKTVSAVQYLNEIALEGTGPWDVKVETLYKNEREKVEESISWAGYSLVTDGVFTYPHTAVIGLHMSSEQIGNGSPTRHYHIKGRKILVPSNYDPNTRTYTGSWNGLFKRAWSNNPAWVLYDMVENDVFGLREHIDLTAVNKWQLYTIAQRCDELVPSGYYDDEGKPIMESRATFNGVITDKKEALDALRSMTAVWQGMGFYALNQFHTTMDAPQDIAYIYSPSNVIDGRFEYSTSSLKTRNSVVMVKFNDPNNLFEPALEPYVDNELVHQIGWREKSVQLTGCASRSQARRYARWILETEKSETETVTFTVGLDSIAALPGEVVGISDPRRAQVRVAGRVKTKDPVAIYLDQPMPAEITGNVTMRVQSIDGGLIALEGTISTDRLRFQVRTADQPLIAKVAVDAQYLVSSPQLAPETFRILSIDEAEDNTFKITALQYDATKFARIEQGIHFEPLPTTIQRDNVLPPPSITSTKRVYADGGNVRTDVELSWVEPETMFVQEYRVFASSPTTANVAVYSGLRPSATYSTTESGQHTITIYTVSLTGALSAPATYQIEIEGAADIPVGQILNLRNADNQQTGSATFTGRDIKLAWQNIMAVSNDPNIDVDQDNNALYKRTTLEFFMGGTKVRTVRTKGSAYTYKFEENEADAKAAGLSGAQRSVRVEVYLEDMAGRQSARSAIELTNAAPAAPTSVTQFKSFNEVTFTIPFSEDQDARGYMAWLGTSSDFTPSTSNRIYRGTNNSFTYKGPAGETLYLKVAAFDAFSEADVRTSSGIRVDFGADVEAAAAEVAQNAQNAAAAASAAAGARDTAQQAANVVTEALNDAQVVLDQVPSIAAKVDAAISAKDDSEAAFAGAAQAHADADAAKVDALAAKAAAESARDNAMSSVTSANSAKSAAEAAKTAAETARTQAQTAATNAGNSASAAAGSASTAGTKATEAGQSASAAAASAVTASNKATQAQDAADAAATSASSAATFSGAAETSATAANTAKLAAETARTGAQSARDAAVMAKESAQASEATAVEKAGLAANSATAAGASATAAANSATTASTKATEASQSAATATTQAQTATTKAGEASTSATQAAQSKSDAAGSATAASTSATTAANAVSNVQNVLNNTPTLVSKTALGREYFTATRIGDPSTIATNGSTTMITDEVFGSSLRWGVSGIGSNMMPKAVLPVGAGQVWRVKVRFRLISAPAESHPLNMVISFMKADYTLAVSSDNWTARALEPVPADGSVIEWEATISTRPFPGITSFVAPNATYARVGLRSGDAGSILAVVDAFEMQDVTSVYEARVEATAANISASQAAASVTAAGESATAATTAKSAAETARSAAEAARDVAVSAKDTATASATTATEKANLAANSATAAGNSATAAASSATTASSKATEAGTAATTATNAKTAAETARTQAQSARDTAVTAKETAQSAASTATNKATLAANSATAAGNSASAAATSATTASTKATEAGTAATTASTAAQTATTKAGEASTSASNAAASASDASGSASAASSSASTAATTLTNAQVALNNAQRSLHIIPNAASAHIGTDNTGLSATYAPLTTGYATDGTLGAYVRRAATASLNGLYARATVPSAPDRVYRVTARVRAIGGTLNLRLVAQWVAANGSSIANGSYMSQSVAEADGVVTLTMICGSVAGGLVGSVIGTTAHWTNAVGLRFGVNVQTGVASTSFDLFELTVDDLTDADKAARSADGAAGSASAAATSASNAAASNTAAGQHATAATQAKTEAETARGQAQAFRDEVAGSVTTAEGHASTASAAAGVTASLKDATLRALMQTVPQDVDAESTGFTNSIGGNQESRYTVTHGYGGANPIVPVDGGHAVQITHTGNVHVAPRQYLMMLPGRRYRLTVVARHVGPFGPNSATSLSMLARRMNAETYASAGDLVNTSATFTAVDTWQTFNTEWDAPTSGTLLILPFAYTKGGNMIGLPAGSSVQIRTVKYEDITESASAATSANAAAGSASTATVKANEAGLSASAADTAKTEAQTARGQAQTFASDASNSADTAAGHSASAGIAAGVAAESKQGIERALMAAPVLPSIAALHPDQWVSSRTGLPEALTPVASSLVTGDADFGSALAVSQFATPGATLATRGRIPIGGGRVWRIKIKFKVTAIGGGNTSVQFQVIVPPMLDNGAVAGASDNITLGGNYDVALNEVNELSILVSDVAGPGVLVASGFSTASWIRYGLRKSSSYTCTILLHSMIAEDVTAEVRGGIQASAAADSASIASTKATEASQSATAANTSRTNAETARGQAQTFANNAATSATNAANSASAASTSSDTAASALVSAQTAINGVQQVISSNGDPASLAFSTASTLAPDAVSPLNASNYGSDSDGKYIQRPMTSANTDTTLRSVSRVQAKSVFKITATVKCSAAQSVAVKIHWLSGAWASIGSGLYHAQGVAANTLTTFTWVIGFSASESPMVTHNAGARNVWNTSEFIRFGLRSVNAVSGGNMKIYSLTVEDMTPASLASVAEAAASTSVGAATTATNAEANALNYSQNAARLMSGGVSKNPIFNVWPAGSAQPTNVDFFVGSGNTITRHTAATSGALIRYENACYMKSGGTTVGPHLRLQKSGHALDCNISPKAVLITAEVEYIAGDLATSGAFVRAGWIGTPTRYMSIAMRNVITATPGVIQKVEFYAERPADAVPASATNFYVDFIANSTSYFGTLQAGLEFRVHRLDFQEVLENSQTAITQQAIADLSGIKSAVIGLRAEAGSAGARLELVALDSPTGTASTARINATKILLEGSVKAEHIAAESISTEHLSVDWLNAGRMQAAYLDVNSMLTIEENAGMRFGKTGVNSDTIDGIYLGRTGTQNFGFALSRTQAGRRQMLKLTNATGLQMLNARHFVSGATLPVTVGRTTNLAKTALPAGIQWISLEAIGGGSSGVGNAGNSTNSPAANPGTDTVIKLYDGNTLKYTFTANGAATPELGLRSGASNGKASAYGKGGTGATLYQDATSNHDPVAAKAATSPAATSYGAGGGASYLRRGGLSAAQLVQDAIDVSSWASPMIEITVGVGGAGVQNTSTYSDRSTSYSSAAGANGYVAYTYSVTKDLPADVVPLNPTATGTFSKVANTAGSFPDLGAGLWIIDLGTVDAGMQLGDITISPGVTVGCRSNSTMTFVSSQTPTYAGGANGRTIFYTFYSMGSWG